MKEVLYLLIFLFGILSCGSIQPEKPIFQEKLINPESELGTIRIPITYNLTSIFDQVNDGLDYEFKGKQEKCEDVSFAYVFKRNPIEFSGKNDAIITSVNGAYSIKANYCSKCSNAFGLDSFCVTPRLYVSCGIGEPLRKIKLQFETQLKLQSDYQLIGKSKLTELKTVDPCKFTFIKYDASKLIENEISKALKTVEKTMDAEIAKINLKEPITLAWEALQKPVAIPNIGFLNLNPQSIGIDQFEFTGNKVTSVLELSVLPEVNSYPHTSSLKPLPRLKSNSYPDGLKIPVQFNLNYDSINSLINNNFKEIPVLLGKKEIKIQKIELIGPQDLKTVIRVEFDGAKKGVLFLIGNPTFSKNGTSISFQQVEFDVKTKSILLKSAKWMFQDLISKKIEEKLILDLTTKIKEATNQINTILATKININNQQSIVFKGTVEQIIPKAIGSTADFLNVHVLLLGNIEALVN